MTHCAGCSGYDDAMRDPIRGQCPGVLTFTLDEVKSFFSDLDPQQEEDWLNQLIAAQQRRLRKRIKARLQAARDDKPYGETHYGPLGAEREG